MMGLSALNLTTYVMVMMAFLLTDRVTVGFVPTIALHKHTEAKRMDLNSAIDEKTSISTDNSGSDDSFEIKERSFLSDEDGVPPPLHESSYTQVLSTMSLSLIANRLRDAYDYHFQDPRQPNGDRFAWDPWFVLAGDGRRTQINEEEDENDLLAEQQTTIEGEENALSNQIQYSLKRIQTSLFFSEDDYNDLVDELVSLANSIGLTAISPPWTSMYTDGDTQNFHTDAAHGPMAFVLSLSKNGDFRGGETVIMKPKILDLWRDFSTGKAMECGNIIRYIPPTPLGRCIAFDPRVPHGVNRVIGSNDPRNARVVVHGWFNEPETCWFGSWGDEDQRMEAATYLDEALQPLVATIGSGEIGRVVGYLAVRVEIDEDGCVDHVYATCDTIQADMEDFRGVIGYDEADRPVMEDAVGDIRLNVYEALKNLQFEDGAVGRALVVPFVFE